MLSEETIGKEQVTVDTIFDMSVATGGVITEKEKDANEAIVAGELSAAAVILWERIGERIKSAISAQSYTTWFGPVTAKSLEGTKLMLIAPSTFISEWILQHYQELIENALQELLGQSASFGFEHADDIEGLETTLIPASAPVTQVLAAPSPEPRNRIEQPLSVYRENRPANNGKIIPNRHSTRTSTRVIRSIRSSEVNQTSLHLPQQWL